MLLQCYGYAIAIVVICSYGYCCCISCLPCVLRDQLTCSADNRGSKVGPVGPVDCSAGHFVAMARSKPVVMKAKQVRVYQPKVTVGRWILYSTNPMLGQYLLYALRGGNNTLNITQKARKAIREPSQGPISKMKGACPVYSLSVRWLATYDGMGTRGYEGVIVGGKFLRWARPIEVRAIVRR